MWHPLLPPIRPIPAFDFGLTTAETLTILLTLAIAAAAVAQAFVASRLFRLQRTIEADRKRVDVYFRVMTLGRPILAQIMNLSPTGIGVREITFSLKRRDVPKDTLRKKPVSIPIRPYDSGEVDLVNDLEYAAGRLHVPDESGNMPLSGQVTATYVAHGETRTTAPALFEAVFTLSGQFTDFREL